VARARHKGDVSLDIAYLVLVVLGASLLIPKYISDDALRKKLNETETELSATKKTAGEINESLDKTRQQLAIESSKREHTEAELMSTKQNLAKAQNELSDVNRRESLRGWAMLMPSGNEASDVMGRETRPVCRATRNKGSIGVCAPDPNIGYKNTFLVLTDLESKYE
jgi:hypothetical protein